MTSPLLILLGKRNKPVVDWNLLSNLPPALTFANASGNRSCFGANGVMQFANVNVPRFDYNPATLAALGLLYEPQRTNAHTRSWRISAWNNNSSTVTDNALLSPDGTQNASTITVTGSNQGRWISVGGLTPSTYYAVSGFAKYVSGSILTIRTGFEVVEDGTQNGMIVLNLTTGAITPFANSVNVYGLYSVLLPSGWVYFRYYIKTGVSQTSASFVSYSWDYGGVFSPWGLQVEALGASPGSGLATSLIKTDGSTVTRAADQLSYAIPNGVTRQRLIFDDASYQDTAVTPGAYTLDPSAINRSHIKRIHLWRS